MSMMSSVSGGLHSFGGGCKNIKRVVADAVSSIGLVAVAGSSILASGPSGSVPLTSASPLAYAAIGLGVLSFVDNAVQANRDSECSANTTLGMMSSAALTISGMCMVGGTSPEAAIGFSVVAAGIMGARWLAQLKKGMSE